MAEQVNSLIPREEFHEFVVRCMTAVGTRQDDARALADLLVAADYRGHYSHGLNRLDMYVRDVQSTMTVTDKSPEIVKETAATAFVNGNNLLGPVVGRFCIDLAIQKAKDAGIGWVVAKGSNHFGIAGWYSMRAMEQGLVGMAFTNTSPLLVPTRAKDRTLGTNPISVAAPANNGDSYVLDMATTAVALGKIELNDRKGIEAPIGWGTDRDGKPCSNPAEIVDNGGLMPLGGPEECSGYKGYGLSMMVELFCGILGGCAFGPNVRTWKTTDREANLGQCFVALDPSAFAPGFEGRMSQLIDHCRGLQPAEGESEVLVPGDPERKHMAKCDSLGGIPYHPNQVKYANDLAASLNIAPMKPL
ncbi:uncharacterized oxidoreductase YjmC-like [Haliotis cracherodii]|uniref:uncharacterized oxidoreductase YjmC-like n=1 Tax=Haliotis cracherodii TaxID=6455 RepID=UPI0039ED66F5